LSKEAYNWEKEYNDLIASGVEADRSFESDGSILMPDEEIPWWDYPDNPWAKKFGIEWERQCDVADERFC
jgi:hypothetical protein